MRKNIPRVLIFLMWTSVNIFDANAQSQKQTFFGSALKSLPNAGISAYGIKFANGSNEAIEIETTYLKAFEFSGLASSTITGPSKNANFLVRIEKDKANSFVCPESGFSWSQLKNCFENGEKDKRPGAPSSQFSVSETNVVTIYDVASRIELFLKCTETRTEPPVRFGCSFLTKLDGYVVRVNAPVNLLHRQLEVYCAVMQVQAAVWSDTPFKPSGKCKRPQ